MTISRPTMMIREKKRLCYLSRAEEDLAQTDLHTAQSHGSNSRRQLNQDVTRKQPAERGSSCLLTPNPGAHYRLS